VDHRRAVSRFVISPERARGLDLERLTRAAVARLESEMGVGPLSWIAAIHRNTRHHHVHLVLAGVHQDAAGGYRRVDISKPQLAAMKEAVCLEIERQRGERAPSRATGAPDRSGLTGRDTFDLPALELPVARPALIRALPVTPPARHRATASEAGMNDRGLALVSGSVLALRAAARRYRRRMEHELESEARRLGRERAA
jgi:hypothetical protein